MARLLLSVVVIAAGLVPSLIAHEQLAGDVDAHIQAELESCSSDNCVCTEQDLSDSLNHNSEDQQHTLTAEPTTGDMEHGTLDEVCDTVTFGDEEDGGGTDSTGRPSHLDEQQDEVCGTDTGGGEEDGGGTDRTGRPSHLDEQQDEVCGTNTGGGESSVGKPDDAERPSGLDEKVDELLDKSAELHGRRATLTADELAGADYLATEIRTQGRESPPPAKVPHGYEYPPLTRLEPGRVGDFVEVELEPGVTYRRITKAVHPPVFEIPEFLSPGECKKIRQAALAAGLKQSILFGKDIKTQYAEKRNLSDVTRVSDNAWVSKDMLGGFWRRLLKREAALTQLDIGIIERSENMQVVKYEPGGHYHAHLDTTNGKAELPCCGQTSCANNPIDCCRLCRYATVLYYLDDVKEGGETAFPMADLDEEAYQEKQKRPWRNLSYYCHNSSLVVSPRRGTAIMWYNHFTDPETGYLGLPDVHSYHGGCDIKKGRKWIGNHWISATPYSDRFRQRVWE